MRLAAFINLAIAIAALMLVAAARRSALRWLLRRRAYGGRPADSAPPLPDRLPDQMPDRLRDRMPQGGDLVRHAVPGTPAQRPFAPELAQSRCGARRALARQEFVLCYQPLLDLRLGRVVGARALLRWRHPERGLLMPAEFIDELEQSGQTLPVGAWALATAAAQAARWIEQGCSLTVSLRLSARQFYQPDLAADFAALLRQAGLPACHIELEVGAAMLIDKRQDCETILHRLRQRGMGVVIRDASGGRGPFNYLRRFAANALWLDAAAAGGRFQAATTGAGTEQAVTETEFEVGAEAEVEAEAEAPLRAAIELAHALGRRVAAGPVATPAQLARLAALGCDLAYGEAVGAAMPAEELGAAIRAGGPAWQLRAATPAPAPSAAADATRRPADSACR